MKFFIDENLSPQLASTCHARGYDATSLRDRSGLSRLDHSIAAMCLEEERICVTANAGDFRELAEVRGVHPGLITVPSVSRARQIELLEAAISFIEETAQATGLDPAALMINHVVEIDEAGACELCELPGSS
jgi:predicted nuclease of predicted toxin-antitoxin system